MTIEERVAKGAALLDEKVPGWEEKIDLDHLLMGTCQHCILGQAMGYYGSRQLHALGFAPMDKDKSDEYMDVSYGFDKPSGAHEYYTDLEAAWTTLILNRRKERALSAPTATSSPSP